jgi:hypothetical protein
MTRKCVLLFCANEHGTGDVTFPDVDGMTAGAIKQLFIDDATTGRLLRKQAKAAGWGRINGEDYCPGCMETESDQEI